MKPPLDTDTNVQLCGKIMCPRCKYHPFIPAALHPFGLTNVVLLYPSFQFCLSTIYHWQLQQECRCACAPVTLSEVKGLCVRAVLPLGASHSANIPRSLSQKCSDTEHVSIASKVNPIVLEVKLDSTAWCYL